MREKYQIYIRRDDPHNPSKHFEHERYEDRRLIDNRCQLDNFPVCVLPILSQLVIIEESVSVIRQVFCNAIGSPREEVRTVFECFANFCVTAQFHGKN